MKTNIPFYGPQSMPTPDHLEVGDYIHFGSSEKALVAADFAEGGLVSKLWPYATYAGVGEIGQTKIWWHIGTKPVPCYPARGQRVRITAGDFRGVTGVSEHDDTVVGRYFIRFDVKQKRWMGRDDKAQTEFGGAWIYAIQLEVLP